MKNHNSNEDAENTVDLTMSSPVIPDEKELLVVELAWRSDFKNKLKEVNPTFQPSEELIDKYRLRNYSTVSDAIHAWLRQREEVLSISSDSNSANQEGVTRKKSSTTETSSDRQQELKKKKPKSENNNDVNNLAEALSKASTTDSGSKSDTMKSTSVRKSKSSRNKKTIDDDQNATSIRHAWQLNHDIHPYALLSPPSPEESARLVTGRVASRLGKQGSSGAGMQGPSVGLVEPEEVSDVSIVNGFGSAQPLLSSSTMAARRSQQEDDDEALAQALQGEEYHNESITWQASRGGSEAQRSRSLSSDRETGGVSRERRGRSVSSGRGSQGRSLSSGRGSQDGRRVAQDGKPKSILKPATSGGSGSTAGTKVGSGASLKVPPAGVIESDDDDYDSDDSDWILTDEEEEAYDHILEEEKEETTKKYFFPPKNYVWVRERQGIYTVSTCREYIRHYIERTDPKNRKLLKEMRWNPKVFTMDQDYIINVLAGVQTRYLNRKNHQNRVFPPHILEDIRLLASLLGDENWLPDYVQKIDEALGKTEEHKRQSSKNSSPSRTILLGLKLMCPKPNRHLNEGNDGNKNGPTEKACKAISTALQDSLKDCGSQFLNPLLSFGSFLGHERSTCPCTSPSFRHQGCGWETSREGIVNAFIRNLLVQLCLQYNCTMIWLNFNGANGEFAFDLQDHNIVSYKKLFHPSLATYANCKVYGNEKNQKHKVSRRVRGLAEYLGTQFGYKFDKSKFLATVSESIVLPMINMQNNTPFLKSSLPSGFVNKYLEQKWEKNYAACWNYKEENGNFKGLQTSRQYGANKYKWLGDQFFRSKDVLTVAKKEKLYLLHKGMENNNKLSKDFILWYETGIINDRRPKASYGENDVARREAKSKSRRESARRNYEQGGGRRNECRIEGCSTGARQRHGFCAFHGGRGRNECRIKGCSTGARKKGLCAAHGGK